MDIFGKDEVIGVTINKIKSILRKFAIEIVEKWYESGVKGCYTVRLTIKGTDIGTNGKGVSKDLALASAYGEFVERLQNGFLYAYKGNEDTFFIEPDEKFMTKQELINQQSKMIKKILEGINFKNNQSEIEQLSIWEKYCTEGVNNKFLAYPFLNITKDKLEYLPKQMRIAYGSNGMVAGNTFEEAMVQGISEIIERYVQVRVIKNKICPPSIPRTIIEKFYPDLYKSILDIEKQGDYYIEYKDCSLNEGYPVVGLVIIDRLRQQYIVKFGAHPIQRIAMERCLTEAFQGRSLSKLSNEYTYNKRIISQEDNIMSNLKFSYGVYPEEFFLSNFDYHYTNFSNITFSNNEEMLIYYLKLLKEKELEILVRDQSFLGFPTYHIVIPGMSEIFRHDEFFLRMMNTLKTVRRTMSNIENATDDDLKLVSLFINYNRKLPYMNDGINYYYPKKYRNKVTEDLYSELLFLLWCEIVFEDWNKALNFSNLYNKKIENSSCVTYYKCLNEFIRVKIDKRTESDIFKLLKCFFPIHIAENVIYDMKNKREKFYNMYGNQFRQKLTDDSNNTIQKIFENIHIYKLNNRIEQQNLMDKLHDFLSE